MVSLFGFEIKRKGYKPSPKSGYTFDDEDQHHATEVKRLKAEQRKLQAEMALERQKLEFEKQKFELESLRDELYGDDEEDEQEGSSLDKMLVPILMGAFVKQPAPPVDSTPVASVQKVQYTDDEIREILKQVPKHYIKLAQKMDDTTVRKFLYAQQPNVSDDTIERALKILRE